MSKFDNFKLGLVLGIIAPLFGMLGFYFWKFSVYPFKEFLSFIFTEKRLLTSMVTFSLFANAVVFTVFINKHYDKTAKGIFIVTIVWSAIAIALKYIF
jgi:tryptophan-rich sensory protein